MQPLHGFSFRTRRVSELRLQCDLVRSAEPGTAGNHGYHTARRGSYTFRYMNKQTVQRYCSDGASLE